MATRKDPYLKSMYQELADIMNCKIFGTPEEIEELETKIEEREYELENE